MKVIYSTNAKKERQYLEKKFPALAKQLDKIIASIQETPFNGIGKPKSLKDQLNEFWCRRINYAHRLVYRIVNNQIQVAQCFFHY